MATFAGHEDFRMSCCLAFFLPIVAIKGNKVNLFNK